ncbi:aconitate hydratase AcnA [Elusimicrobiota bacterium]
MKQTGIISLESQKDLKISGDVYSIFSLDCVKKAGLGDISRLPYSLKILLENLLRNEKAGFSSVKDVEALANWDPKKKPDKEIAFTPSRVILQDFTGVPCVVDLAAMRDQMTAMKGDPKKINPIAPVDLVIDHSVQIDEYGHKGAFAANMKKEYERNSERYAFLRWGQNAFKNFQVVPPDTGIIHQVNLEYLARVVFAKTAGSKTILYPDTVIGTDSHTTMINCLGVLGWGVGGIEAEAAMLGQPVTMLIPQVVGFKLSGKLKEDITATDLVLTITQMLRAKGVVGKFVEYFGSGLDNLAQTDRATIANMAPEYGATMGFFPVDSETIEYLKLTGRDTKTINIIETYLKEQGLFRTKDNPEPVFSDTMELDLSTVEASIAGPKRPQDRITLKTSKKAWDEAAKNLQGKGQNTKVTYKNETFDLDNGAVVIASITSCTNTSNPEVLIEAGLLAKKAHELGLRSKPWVKTSLAPGSRVVTEYLNKAGLTPYLEELGFHLAGYGCATCIGNSGPLPEPIEKAVKDNNMLVVSVLSGNRNFEGRISPFVKANYLASPPLVVAYALAGTMNIDLSAEPLGKGKNGKDVYLKDIWPTRKEAQDMITKSVKNEMFKNVYADVFKGSKEWGSMKVPTGDIYSWDTGSTYIRKPPFFEGMGPAPRKPADIKEARVLALLGDSVTTDHISPAGSISARSPAAKYLADNKVEDKDFNSYGSRRGNHEVMMRGTFANVRIKNQLIPGTEGGYTKHMPGGEEMSIYDACVKYRKDNVPLVVIAQKEYGTGSSRDWAAKGTALLGVQAVIAESFERIHRSNLVGMGVMPLEFKNGDTYKSLGLTGDEIYTIEGISEGLTPGKDIAVRAKGPGKEIKFTATLRIDTPQEIAYYEHGGILQYVLRQLAK